MRALHRTSRPWMAVVVLAKAVSHAMAVASTTSAAAREASAGRRVLTVVLGGKFVHRSLSWKAEETEHIGTSQKGFGRCN
jgi:hypothetical protein